MDEFPAALSKGCFDLIDEFFQPLGRGRPLRLLDRELVCCLPDLLRRGIHLVCGGFLLLGGQHRLLQHRHGGPHQLPDLAGLLDPLLSRHDRRVRLILDAGDDHADRVR
jgi:hypothetical protein